MDGYCFKCKTMKEMANATETRTRNGKPAMSGTCVTCGTRMFKLGMPASDPAANGLPAAPPAAPPVQATRAAA